MEKVKVYNLRVYNKANIILNFFWYRLISNTVDAGMQRYSISISLLLS